MATIRTKAALYAKYSSTTGPTPVTTASLYATYGTLTLASGSTGWAVRDLQLELNRRGFAAGDGRRRLRRRRRSARCRSFQKAAMLTVTGKVAANDWKALSGLAYTKTALPRRRYAAVPGRRRSIPGFNADGTRRRHRPHRARRPLLLPRPRSAASRTPVRIGRGWNVYRQVVSPGDLDGDGIADVLAVTTPARPTVYRGNGKGGCLAGASWSHGRGRRTPTS